MRLFIALLLAPLVLAACGNGDTKRKAARAEPEEAPVVADRPVGVAAAPTRRIDFASCLAEDMSDDAAKSTRCPSFALLSLDYMATQCAAHGGKLVARQPSEAWSLDVDGDASAEVLVDLVGNFDCEGAPGAFACGSTGCPFLLYKKRAESWVELGAINADDAPGIQVMPAEAGKNATLRGGCTGLEPCSELTHYEWDGKSYVRTWIDFKGHAVDVAPRSLMTLTQDSSVLDGPDRKKASVLDEYPVGTAMIVIGTAREGPYTFVSPCSSCRRGFIETSLLAKQG
jgi:hypothetical protein